MCPDHQIISLYLDGELPSPWKEKLETHLESCPACQAVLSGYRGLVPEAVPAEAMEAARERVWEKLISPELLTGRSRSRGEGLRLIRKAWNRRIMLPLPLAAAALLVVMAAFFILAGIRGTQALPQNSIAAIGLDDYGTVPLQDMNGLLQYLSSQDNGDFMVIRLPESKKFSPIGEPALINAADYSRTRRNFSR